MVAHPSSCPPPVRTDFDRLCGRITETRARALLQQAKSDDLVAEVTAAVLGCTYPSLNSADELQRLARRL